MTQAQPLTWRRVPHPFILSLEGSVLTLASYPATAAFVEELPDVFLPVADGWGRNGATHICLAAATEDVLAGALRTAWKLRLEKNAKSGTIPGKESRPNAKLARPTKS